MGMGVNVGSSYLYLHLYIRNVCIFQCFLCYFVRPSYLNLCRFQWFLCYCCYTFLSRSMLFPTFPLVFVGMSSYLHLCFLLCFLWYILVTFLADLCIFRWFLCYFCYISLSKSMHLSISRDSLTSYTFLFKQFFIDFDFWLLGQTLGNRWKTIGNEAWNLNVL